MHLVHDSPRPRDKSAATKTPYSQRRFTPAPLSRTNESVRALGLIFTGWCVLFSAAAAWAAKLEELPFDAAYEVRAIRIEGLKALSKGTVRGVMLTSARVWYKPWTRWTQEHPFNPDLFRTDLERIRMLLRESGFYLAQVDHDLVIDDDEISIVLHVEEGPRVTVEEATITVTDLDLAPEELEALRAQLVLRQGGPFTQEAYDESRARLLRYYLTRGFPYVEVEKRALVNTSINTATVTYEVTRGPPAVFGVTEVTGTDGVDEDIVRREITYRPGAPYDPAELERTQATIFGLQLFRSVIVEPANLAERSGVVDVRIAVVEGPSRSIRVGIGYGLEDEIRGQFEWRNNNFLGGGRRLRAALKASFITQSAEAELVQPHFLHPKQSLVVPLTQGRDDEPGYTLFSIRLAPRLRRVFPGHLSVSLGYGIEYDGLSDVPEETVASLDDFRVSGFVSSFFGAVERNTADDLLDPKRGSILLLSAEQAGGPWQGDFTFYRAVFDAKKYFQVPGERVIAGRFRIGAGDGFGQSGDLPLFRRFYAGGVTSTRGYDRHRVGPLTSGGDPIGGRSLMEGSIEFRTPVYKEFGGVVFFDAGLVDQRLFRYPLGDLQFGAGPGIRYQTLIGPLRLDLGFPIDPPSGQPSWRVHFSVGQAF
jgi:outer membrane protein assembly complex protein YaeT